MLHYSINTIEGLKDYLGHGYDEQVYAEILDCLERGYICEDNLIQIKEMLGNG